MSSYYDYTGNIYQHGFYAIFDCDEWKSKYSMRLIGISDCHNLNAYLHEIQDEHEYTNDDMETYIHIQPLCDADVRISR